MSAFSPTGPVKLTGAARREESTYRSDLRPALPFEFAPPISTTDKWHSIEFWVKDKAGKKHHFARWLVFGVGSKQVAQIMRDRGIEGG